ncbi:MAG: hypothetical protein CMJ32_00770 [Phycisphaerae bacterium]|nr:hypothetical protein [Phycisphaerae bacterium]
MKTFNRTCRTVAASAAVFLVSQSMLAQESNPNSTSSTKLGADAPFWAQVIQETVDVRSAPSMRTGYPFATLEQEQRVEVMEIQDGWARIRASGTAFEDDFAYILDDQRAQLDPDTGMLVISARTELRAPNMDAQARPEHSWKQIARLEPGMSLQVIDRLRSDQDTVWRVQLPQVASGWVNATSVMEITEEPATPAKVDTTSSKAIQNNAQVPSNAPATIENSSTENETVQVEVDVVEVQVEEVVTRPGEALLESLESSWVDVDQMSDDDLAEYLQQYLVLAENESVDEAIAQMAQRRARQLQLKNSIRQRLAQLDRLRQANSQQLEQIESAQVALDARSEYNAVGRLNASAVYNGERLPQLYRVRDPGSGQTILYLEPDNPQITAMLGQVVGIVGTTRFDERLQLNIIEPRRIDILIAAD